MKKKQKNKKIKTVLITSISILLVTYVSFGKSVDRSLLLQIIPFSNMNGFTGRASYFQFKV